MGSFIPANALPQSINVFAWPLNTLNKNLFPLKQVACDVQAFVFFATLAQQVEKMQATQLMCRQGLIDKTFKHDKLTIDTFFIL